jgi:Kef-type K+ transport system membrane component KefB
VTSALAPIAPLPAHQALVFLLQLAVLLSLALALGAVARRLGMPAIVGELTAGVLLGPSVLGHLAPRISAYLLPRQPQQAHLLDALGLVAVLLLVGATGSHIDTDFLRRRRGAVLAIFLCGLLLPLGLGIVLGLALPGSLLPPSADRVVFALFMGVAMGVSAIPVLAKTLTDMDLLHRDVGQLAMAACVADDTVAWCLLSIVAAMATTGVHLTAVLVAVLSVAGFLVAAWLVGRPLVGAGMRLADRTNGSSGPVAVAVLVILLGATATQALGLEAVFGAFVAGVLVIRSGAGDPKRLAPLWTMAFSVLAPLYMATAGLRMDLTALREPAVALTAVAALVVAVGGKFAGAFLGGTLIRLPRWERIALGAGMNSRGVVEVVVATVGLSLGVLSTAAYTIVILIALATSVMTPPLLRIAMSRVEHSADEQVRRQMHEMWRTPVGGAATAGERAR